MNLQLKMIAYSAVIVLLFVTFAYIYQNRADANAYPLTERQQTSIRIVRMKLQGFSDKKIGSAKSALWRVPGIVEVKVEPAQQRVIVWMDVERANLQMVERSLHEVGFTPLYR